MTQAVQTFLENYEAALAKGDSTLITSLYADSFMFADPSSSVRVVERTAFAAMLPKRTDFFATVGLQKTKLGEVHEQLLSEGYHLVLMTWTMHFKKAGKLIQSVNKATYILAEQDGQLYIVFQLDHQNLMQRVRELGLL
ncbi:MAG TPA: hypothetical protein VNG90_00055 [Candidatus Acidoferrum sp.]|nr:hypothetical protein [Candidatus Acidoferrum sp.]